MAVQFAILPGAGRYRTNRRNLLLAVWLMLILSSFS